MRSKRQIQVPQNKVLSGCKLINPTEPRHQTKEAIILELISSKGGVTLEELTSATGWLPHTTRAAIIGLRKRGHDVHCKRVDGVSRYTIRSDGE